MLIDPFVEELLPRVENRYTLTLLTAKRCRQLVDGAQPLSQRRSENPLTQACMEVQEEKIKYVQGQEDVAIPLRLEVLQEREKAQSMALAKKQEAIIEEAKLNDPGEPTVEQRRQFEREENAALQEQNARKFTAQLLEIFSKQDEELERGE